MASLSKTRNVFQVTEITEVVFNGVPKKHHLNCGFSIVSFHPITQQQQTFNLLTEVSILRIG